MCVPSTPPLSFQSRNRESFDFRYRDPEIAGRDYQAFQSRNRESFDFSFAGDKMRRFNRTFQSRNRESFDFSEEEKTPIVDRVVCFNLVIESLLISGEKSEHNRG